MPANKEFYGPDTLIKVYKALMDNGIVGQKAVDVVSSLQNEGILFREAVPGVREAAVGAVGTPKRRGPGRPRKDAVAPPMASEEGPTGTAGNSGASDAWTPAD